MSSKPVFKMRIGIDYGGVCSVSVARYESSESSEKDNKTVLEPINVDGCLEALLSLKKKGHTLHLISFCGKQRAILTRKYLNDLFPNLFDELYFVKDRKYKSVLCESLGIDYMIDDRYDILRTIRTSKTILFGSDQSPQGSQGLQGSEGDDKKTDEEPVVDVACKNWIEVEQYLDTQSVDSPKPTKPIEKLSKLCYL